MQGHLHGIQEGDQKNRRELKNFPACCKPGFNDTQTGRTGLLTILVDDAATVDGEPAMLVA